jgi:hypothetical protein
MCRNAPLSSTLIVTSWAFRVPVKPSLVNGAALVTLKVSGRPYRVSGPRARRFQHPALLLALFVAATEQSANAGGGFGDSRIALK